jgi:hypothetical protein
MHNKKRKYSVVVALWLPLATMAAPLPDFQFKSPSFTGVGYSSHVLTIAKDIQAAIDKAKSDAQNTNIQKFLNNLESRIYAQISQNLATAMFANNNCTSTNSVGCSGTLNFEGNTIFWNKDSSNVYLQVTDTIGNQTTITVPLGTFQFGN